VHLRRKIVLTHTHKIVLTHTHRDWTAHDICTPLMSMSFIFCQPRTETMADSPSHGAHMHLADHRSLLCLPQIGQMLMFLHAKTNSRALPMVTQFLELVRNSRLMTARCVQTGSSASSVTLCHVLACGRYQDAWCMAQVCDQDLCCMAQLCDQDLNCMPS